MSYKLSSTLSGHEQDVRDLSITAENQIISVSRDSTTRIWQHINHSNSDSTIIFHSPTSSFINSVAYIHEGTAEPLIASGGQDAMIYLNDVYHGKDTEGKYQLIGHEGNVCALDYSQGELISSSWDSTAKVWDLDSFSVKYDLRGHESSVWDCKIIDQGHYLTCSADKSIRLWQGKFEIRKFLGHTDVVRKLLVLPGLKQFMSCSNDGTIRIWDLDSGKNLQTLVGHESFVYDLGILPNGDIVSTGEDRTVRIWTNEGTIKQVITLPCISVWCVVVLNNGDFAVGGSDGEIRVFTNDETRFAPQDELISFKQAVESSTIAEQSLDDLHKTDVPGYEVLEQPGKKEGSTIIVKNSSGTIEAHQWSGGEWHKIGDVVGSASSGKKSVYQGKEYDYVFDVDIKDGEPALKLPYNVNDNPYIVAEKFLVDNELPSTYTEEVVRFIEKNTGGFNLQEGGDADVGTGPADGSRVIDPYADAYVRQQKLDNVLKVIPEKTYIQFVDYKKDSLVNGLNKLNQSQDESVQFSNEQISTVTDYLTDLTSKQALDLITKYASLIIRNWTPNAKLIGYDFIRISIPKITTVDLINSTEAAETILDVLNSGLGHVDESNIALLMMLLKTLNNLIGTTLFVQLYIDPSDDGKTYQYNHYFIKLLRDLQLVLGKISQSAKLYNSTITTLASVVYNLSAYQLQTIGLKNNPRASIPIVEFMEKVGNQIVESNSEAAYRLAVAYGNLKYAKAYDKETPIWLIQAGNLYTINGEQRFIDLVEDLKLL
ncbi:DOA1 [[Candida] subhashii]|uniref:DOA1 n=1 Tax=[Candida] subhashii TaxID=561895 RepID=A0A8J5US58_9ASCO|nr:DOA1 [[Candida] subhashii]KAG7666091.1 DOA1 [[Candida] subhashii]